MKKLLLILVLALSTSVQAQENHGSKANQYISMEYNKVGPDYLIEFKNHYTSNLQLLIEWDDDSMVVEIAQYELGWIMPELPPNTKIKCTSLTNNIHFVLTLKTN